jgi:hypothetical protein
MCHPADGSKPSQAMIRRRRSSRGWHWLASQAMRVCNPTPSRPAACRWVRASSLRRLWMCSPMVLGMTGKGVRLKVATRHQAGLLTFMCRSQEANVTQLCLDRFDESNNSLPRNSVTDPSGTASGSIRVCRGGAWDQSREGCSSALRNGLYSPGLRGEEIGFRLVLSISP